MLYNEVEKLSNFACNLEILCKKILLMPYGNDFKMYKIMTYQRLDMIFRIEIPTQPIKA